MVYLSFFSYVWASINVHNVKVWGILQFLLQSILIYFEAFKCLRLLKNLILIMHALRRFDTC